jgi:predicted chitinase
MLTHPSEQLIISECQNKKLLRNQAAYVLATAKHETGNFRWLREIWGPTKAQQRYEGRKDLGNVEFGDGKRFMGRGFVQITGRRNYKDWSKRLGISLIADPYKAEEPEIAVRILVEGMKLGTFTGKKLSDYITLQRSNFRSARRIVNGMDRADLIARYAAEYDDALKESGYGEDKITDAVLIPKPKAKPEVHKPLVQSKEMVMSVTGIITAITAFLEKVDGSTVALILGALALGFMANRLYARWKDER